MRRLAIIPLLVACAACVLSSASSAQDGIELGRGETLTLGPAHPEIEIFPTDPGWTGVPLSAHGLPSPREWNSVDDFDPITFVADCTLQAQRDRDMCAQLLVTQAMRHEFAFTSAMGFLRSSGLDSPDILGPVVTDANGNRAILLFMLQYPEGRSSAVASLSPCDANHNRFDAAVILVNTRPVASGDAGDEPTRVIERFTGSDLSFMAIHELAHALQYDRYRDAFGVDHTCGDERSPYVGWYVEASAQLVARRYLEHLGEAVVRQLDEFDTFFWGLREYQFGIFWDGDDGATVSYRSGPFYQHLSERYGTRSGSPKLLDVLFPSDNYRPVMRERDTLRWFDNLLRERLDTPPIGPMMALAMVDIASWPNTKHNGFPRSPPGFSRWYWLQEHFNCSSRSWKDGAFRQSFTAQIAAFGGQCVEFVVPAGRGKAELMVRVSSADQDFADALHLAVSDIVTGEEPDAPEANTVFSCADTLDKEPGFGWQACLPIREGPTRSGGEHQVRWVVPVPLIATPQRVRLMVTHAPTRAFGEGERASSQMPVGPENALTMSVTAGLKTTSIASQGLLPTPGRGVLSAINIEPITRAFTAQDFNPFDFGDDARSDPLGAHNADILMEMAGGESVGGPLRAFFFAGGDVDAMRQLPALASGDNVSLDALRAEAKEELHGDGALLGFNVTRNRYTVDHGRLRLPLVQDARVMLTFVEAKAGGFGPVVVTLDDLVEGASFKLGAVSFFAGFGNNAEDESATVEVLKRADDAVTVQFNFVSGPFAGVTAIQTFPFLEHRVRRKDRAELTTATARYYLARWQDEVRSLRGERPVDRGDGDAPAAPREASASVIAATGTDACACSCGAFEEHVQMSTPSRASASFLSCAQSCCDQFLTCTRPATPVAQNLREMCEW